MSVIKRLFAAALLLAVLCTCALAHDVPDLTAMGSISLTIQEPETQEPVSGGNFALYLVGNVQEDDGNYFFAATELFEPAGFDFSQMTAEELGDPNVALGLWEYAPAFSAIQPLQTASLSADGTLVFAPVGVGLYLVVQTEASEGYLPANPFLVSVPGQNEDGTYNYHVDASPKTGVETEPPPVTPPPPPNIPNTGQLRWPIPVLTIAGLLLFALGWYLFIKGKNRYAS